MLSCWVHSVNYNHNYLHYFSTLTCKMIEWLRSDQSIVHPPSPLRFYATLKSTTVGHQSCIKSLHGQFYHTLKVYIQLSHKQPPLAHSHSVSTTKRAIHTPTWAITSPKIGMFGHDYYSELPAPRSYGRGWKSPFWTINPLTNSNVRDTAVCRPSSAVTAGEEPARREWYRVWEMFGSYWIHV